MTTYLLYDDALRSYELRHEITEPIGDPVMFIETAGKRILVGSVLEATIFEKREDVVDEFLNWESFGYRDLVKDDSVATENLGPELVRRVLEKLGVTEASVPPAFRLNVADYLRAHDLDIVVDGEAWDMRRRRKNPTELEGIERAQRATENAMLTAARMLREAEPTSGGLLRFSGEILTAELIREAMQADLLPQGAESEEIIVHSGDACLAGHEIGHGPILPDQSCIIDCFPRDRRSGAYTDMTRTFVPGTPSDELKELHAHCRKALKIAMRSIRPGTSDA
ncbi:MAG: M24 family metallopeptidase, partial [Actinomycetota bacterium]